MGVLGLLPPDDHQLKKECDTVGLPGIYLDQVVSSLYETMYFHDGLGLAAVQVGKSLKMAVMDTDGVRLTLINPEIIAHSEKTVESHEGCLSCPGIEGVITRYKEITIKNYDMQGNPSEITLTGQAAITAQHEIDHMNGILITYRLSSLKRQKYARTVKRPGR